MKVLMFSTDTNILKKTADVHQRMASYGSLFEELHIVLLSVARTGEADVLQQIANNVYVYPTENITKLFSYYDAYRIAGKILCNQVLRTDWVITAQDPFETGLLGYLLRIRYGVPVQLQIHTDFLSPYFSCESLKNKIRVRLACFLIPRVDGIRVVSERIKRSIISNFQFPISNIVVLPIFVEIEKMWASTIDVDLRKKYSQFKYIALMASRLTQEKNIRMAIDAMHTAIKKFPKTGLVIVGDGPQREALISYVAQHKLKKNIVFEPWSEHLVSYYKMADCYVLTSNYEGYGRTAVEALAAQCPVIMTNVGVAGDIVREGISGMIVPIGNSTLLAEALLMLIGDHDLQKRLRDGGLKALASLQSKDGYFSEYREALEKLL